MANELFDKKIKEKLEAVQRPVSPNVWDNIQNKIHTPWYFDFWRKYGLPLYSTIATVLLLVNLKDKYNYEKQFQLLNEKISTVQQIKSETEVQTIVHKDTIYINKTIYVVQRADDKTIVTPPVKRSDTAIPPVITNTNKATEKGLPPEETKNQGIVASETPDKEITNKEETKTDSTFTTTGKDSAAKTTDLKIPSKQNTDTPPKKSFRWPRIDTRLGLTTGYSFNRTIDLGPTFELFLGKSLSLSTGISIYTHPESEYYGPKAFNMQTRQNFTDLYKPHLPSRYDEIEDIHIKASLLTIPLNINYYLPLSRQFDMKFSLGTNIDLRLYQNVKFESHFNGDETYSAFDTEEKKGLWHNMSLGAGLQYQYKRYVFQLMPSYIYHYRETDFLSPKSNFRLSGSVLINLKRDK